MLGRKELTELLKWAKERKDKKGVSLLDRAKRVIEDGSWGKYGAEVTYERWKKGNVFDKIGWICSCPQATYGKPCKHFLAVILIDHKDLLSLISPKWREFFTRALLTEPSPKQEGGKTVSIPYRHLINIYGSATDFGGND